MTKILVGLAAFAIMVTVGDWRQSAEAKIRCVNQWQIVNGQKISTPYCEDGYLARVAQQAGMRVSAAAIRNNPLTKEKACSLVGSDIRVQSICAGLTYDNSRGRF